ncbi:MAG: DUF898 domain-containing protein [Proteobacteria bacterium]|nr:DUF898 domain-containing protein [Pseudomonadota bacterium]
MDQTTANAPQPTAAPARQPQPILFTGRGSEYFGIWIVNLLLTIVTLGIYSSWAKVRRLQYFYRHTELAGSTFDFHGRPLRMFYGRLIALGMLLIYSYSVRLHSLVTLLVLALLALVMPWLLRNSLRFRLYNTSWRGTRFHFRGTVAGAYRVFLLNGFLTMITLYIMAPFMHQRLKSYQHDNSWFGRTRCSFHAGAGRFYLVYLLVLAAIIGFFVVLSMAGVFNAFASINAAQHGGGRVDPSAIFRTMLITYGVAILFGVSIGPAFHALINNLVWNNTRIGEHRLECRMSPVKLAWITLTNLLLLVPTIGLFTPWAAVRLAKYQLESVRLLPASDLQEFVDAEPESPGAVGEEAATAFDFDISL